MYLSQNLDIFFSRLLACGFVGVAACVVDHVLNIASITSLVSVVSPVLINAGTLPGINGATLVAPFACWSYCTVANRVSTSWICQFVPTRPSIEAVVLLGLH